MNRLAKVRCTCGAVSRNKRPKMVLALGCAACHQLPLMQDQNEHDAICLKNKLQGCYSRKTANDYWQVAMLEAFKIREGRVHAFLLRKRFKV